MRTRAWWTSLCLAAAAAACGDQPTEVVPERELMQLAGPVALATSSTEDGLSITTDKDDYQPGDTVWFTGAGWPADDTLDIVLEDEPATHDPHEWWVPVDGSGGFRDSTYVVDVGDLGVTFTLTATSRATGRSLTVQFTDNVTNIVMSDAAPTPFSPNQASSAGLKDQTTITLDNGSGAANAIAVRIRVGTTLAGALVKSFAEINVASNANPTFVWDGKDNSASFVADGIYTARMTNSTGAGTTEHDTDNRKRTIVVDNTNPTVGVDPIAGGTEDAAMAITGTAGDLPAVAGAGLEKVDVTVLRADNTVLASGPATNTGTNFSTWSFSYTPSETGAQKARAKATDNAANNATSADVTFTVVANNQPPTVDAGGPYTVAEGTALTLSPTVGDPDGDALDYKWTVNTSGIDTGGDCTFDDDTALNAKITCTDDSQEAPSGKFILTLEVDDGNGHVVPDNADLTVSNVNPTANAGGPYSGNEGSAIQLSGSGGDAGANDVAGLTFEWSVDKSGIDAGGNCSFSPTNTAQNPTILCTDDSQDAAGGDFTVSLIVRDDDGGVSPASSASLAVQNVNPTANAGGPYSGAEGSAITLTGTRGDAGANDQLTQQWTYTPGAGVDAGATCSFSPNDLALSPTVTCTDDGAYQLTLTVSDDDGGSGASNATLTVSNANPVIGGLTKPDGTALPATIVVAGTLDLRTTFTDAGSNDTHSAELDCGTGYNPVGSVTSPFDQACTFTTVGPKTIRVRVTDDDGGADVATHAISVIYNFEGLFAPVDRPNTLNMSKAGQSIPLKWRLTDFFGNPVLTLAAVTVKASGLACSQGASTDLIEEYAAGASGLQNLGDGHYQFNWKTPAGYASSCKTISLEFVPGYVVGPLAYFTFRK